MQIFLMILGIIIILILLLLLTELKVKAVYENFGDFNKLVVKIYVFKIIRVFKLKKKMNAEKKTFKEKIQFAIDYLFKNKADPIEYAEKEIKKKEGIPKFVKKIDVKKIYIDEFSLDVLLDFDNAAVSAIATGAANAVLGMTLAKYENNIKGPVRYKVSPGYNGNGVKIDANIGLHIKILDIVKLFI